MKNRFTRLMEEFGVGSGGGTATRFRDAEPARPVRREEVALLQDADNNAPPPPPPGNAGNNAVPGDTFGQKVVQDLDQALTAEKAKLEAKGLQNDPGALSQASLQALGKVVGQSTLNLAKLKPGSAEATIAQQELQALVRFQQEIQALFMDLKILPFKLLSAFARGIGLTVLS